MDTLFSHVNIVTMNEQMALWQDAFLGVTDGKIAYMAKKPPEEKPKQIIDGTGMVLMPGLINCHTHLPMYILRGYADDLNLQDWLEHYIFPREDRLDGRVVKAATTLALAEAVRWLDAYFSGREPDFLPPLHPHGTAFQRAVWDILRSIPYGQTMTYGEIARRLAAQQGLSHMSAQAVGGAVGHNPVSILIPCHRVVGADGSLTGYAGGVDKKRFLLELEEADMSGLSIPHRATAR